MKKYEISARARELADRLKTHRSKAGWNVEQFAQRLRWPVEKCTLMETGEWSPSELDVKRVLNECGVPPIDQVEVLELVGSHPHGCWVRPHGDQLPEAAPGVLSLYERANEIVCYDPIEIPVILQNGGYVVEYVKHRFGTQDADVRYESPRCDYHPIVKRDKQRPEVTAFLHESVLRAVPFDEEARWDLYYDLTVIIESKQAEVRIIPAGREATLRLPGFSLVRFASHAPAVCQPCETVTLVLEGHHVAAYEPLVTRLDELALSTLESRDLIVDIAGGQEAMASPPPYVLEAMARDGESWEPEFITEAMAAVAAKREAATAVVGQAQS